jgi:hypothetical protein
MASAKSAEYYLISLSQNTALNQSQFGAQDTDLYAINRSSVIGARYIEVFKSLPIDVQSKLVKITTDIAYDVIRNIFHAHTSNLAFLNFRKSISRFQELNFEIIEILKQASLIPKISTINLALFSDLEAYLKNNPDIFNRRIQDDIIEIIHLLRGYESDIRDLVLNRKESLQEALGQIDYTDFLKKIYGAYLVIVCVYVFLEVKRREPAFAEKVHLVEVIKEGRKFAEGLHGYVNQTIELMNKSNQLSVPRFHLPERVKSYTKELQLGEDADIQIGEFLIRIDQQLRELNLAHRVGIDLFIDAEDPDWRSLMIVVEVAQPLQKTFNELESLFDEMLEKQFSRIITDNIFIQYKSLKTV